MITLRVLLADVPSGQSVTPWALCDAAGRVASRGTGAPATWPRADVREAVLRADAVRIVALSLPPMPDARRTAAASYALEDQLAGSIEAHAVLLEPPRAGSATLARVASRTLLEGLARAGFVRVVAEPDLATSDEGWRWCAGEDGGFVRRTDGSAFAVGPIDNDALPAELGFALRDADAGMPASVRVDAPASADQCAQWSQRHGVDFRPGSRWAWDEGDFAQAPDLLPALAPQRETMRPASLARLFAPALAVGLAALALHVVATAGTWIARRVELANLQRALTDVAAASGIREAGSVSAAIAQAHAVRRHGAGRAADSDAVPLLARVAPAFAALPPDALKGASYAGRAWTFDLAPLDEGVLTPVVRSIAESDVPVVEARHAGGVRVRAGPAP